MTVILSLGIFWTLYGLAGLFGFQVIADPYKGHDWTKAYIRRCGISWLILGIPMLILFFFAAGHPVSRPLMVLLILLCGTPSVLYSFAGERKYRRMLKEK